MKFDDLRWAVGEAVKAVLRGPHDGCDCHRRPSYRGREKPETASTEPRPAKAPERPPR